MDANKNQKIQLWSAKTVGQRLSLSKRQIFRLSACGKIPKPLKIGGAVRWITSDIEQWIAWGCCSRKEFEARRATE